MAARYFTRRRVVGFAAAALLPLFVLLMPASWGDPLPQLFPLAAAVVAAGVLGGMVPATCCAVIGYAVSDAYLTPGQWLADPDQSLLIALGFLALAVGYVADKREVAAQRHRELRAIAEAEHPHEPLDRYAALVERLERATACDARPT